MGCRLYLVGQSVVSVVHVLDGMCRVNVFVQVRFASKPHSNY